MQTPKAIKLAAEFSTVSLLNSTPMILFTGMNSLVSAVSQCTHKRAYLKWSSWDTEHPNKAELFCWMTKVQEIS